MLWWAAQNLVVATALAGLAWALCRTGRVGPVGRHALWLVVLVKLLTPPLVAWPWSVGVPPGTWEALGGGDPPRTPATGVAATVRSPAAEPLRPPVPVVGAAEATVEASEPPVESSTSVAATTGGGEEVGDPRAVPPGPAATLATPPVISASPVLSSRRWVPALLVGAWAVGGVGFLALQGVRIARMRRQLRAARPADAALTDLVADVAGRLGVRPVRAVVIPGLGSPAVWGFGRPVLLWPADLPPGTSAAAARGLVAHELAHVRRRDHWVGWVELAAGVAWWWCPLYWYARHQVRENAELACDGWVVDVLPSGRRAYAEGLLSVCESICRCGPNDKAGPSRQRPATPMPAVGVNTGGRRFLERRLAMIMRDRVPLRLPRTGVVTLAVLALTALPAWSQRATDPAADEPGKKGVPGSAGATRAEHGETGSGDGGTARPGRRNAAEPHEGPAGRPVPAEAQDLLERHRMQQATATAALVRDLEAVRQKLLAAGRADDAAAIAPKIRQLRQSIGMPDGPGWGGLGGVFGGGGPPGRAVGVAPDPGNLYEYRDRVGQTFRFEVVGSTAGSVWGTPSAYTDDSTLAAAAVHAGVVQPGERAVVEVQVLPGRDAYQGMTLNGVTSASYGAWGGSYRVHGGTTRGGAPRGPSPARPDPGTLGAYRDRVGQTFAFRVTGAADGTIWGTDAYTDDSPLATAAVHAGVLRVGETGVVSVTILPGDDRYEGSARNGVTSLPYASFPGGYRVRPAPPPVGVRVYPGLPGAPGGAPAAAAAPDRLRLLAASARDNPPDLSALRGRPNTVLSYVVEGTTGGTVWGSGPYTDDSSLATAAVHAGVLRPGEVGVVKVTLVPGGDAYQGGERNGVTSRPYGQWGGGFTVERGSEADLRAPAHDAVRDGGVPTRGSR